MDTSKRWRTTLLAIAPGILVTLQNTRVGGAVFPFLGTAALVILLLIAVRLHARSGLAVGVITISICGSLLWEAYQLLLVIYGGHLAVTLLKLVLTIALFISLVWLFRSRKRSYLVLSLIVVVLIASGTLAANLPSQSLQFVGLDVSTWLLRVVPFITAGILIRRKQGVSGALLFIAVCELFWLQVYLAPEGIEGEIREASKLTTQLALWLYMMLPPLMFLIISPLIALGTQHANRESLWLLALTLATVCTLSLLRTNLLTPPQVTYVWPNQVMWLEFAALLWAPMLIAFALYRNHDAQPTQAPASV